MRLGTETHSMTNYLMAGSKQPVPRVGDGATICMYTDRHAATIVKVTPTQVHVQQDHAVRIDQNGMSESQEYAYAFNPEAPIKVYRYSKARACYRDATGGSTLAIGHRNSYHDYSF